MVKDYFNKENLMVKELDDSNLILIFKKHSQFKLWNLKFLEFQNMFQNFKSPLPHVDGGVMYITYTTKL